MKGLRILKGLGRSPGKTTVLNEYKEWKFDLKHTDWVNTDSDQVLSGYLAPNELISLLENNIDKEKQ